jgi:crotonobetainyl-CoA:carnitine CoA-transferase CaiB-like acyl-CoA transferase
MYAALGITAALENRQRTGQGRVLDLAMAESVSHMIGPAIIEAARSGRQPPRSGNRDAAMAPQGIYPCQGDDEWIAISVRTDAEWLELLAIVDDDRLRAPAFAQREGRARGHTEIDAVLAAWTCGFQKEALAERLQARGIAAGPVQKVSDFHFDPHLAARDVFQPVDHPAPLLGYRAHPHPAMPWIAVGRRRGMSTDIRPGGMDNAAVLRRGLGMGRRAVARLTAAGALTVAGPFQIEDVPEAPGMPRDEDFAARLGLPGEDG